MTEWLSDKHGPTYNLLDLFEGLLVLGDVLLLLELLQLLALALVVLAEIARESPDGGTVCPRSLAPIYILTYFKNGSRLLGNTVYEMVVQISSNHVAYIKM